MRCDASCLHVRQTGWLCFSLLLPHTLKSKRPAFFFFFASFVLSLDFSCVSALSLLLRLLATPLASAFTCDGYRGRCTGGLRYLLLGHSILLAPETRGKKEVPQQTCVV